MKKYDMHDAPRVTREAIEAAIVAVEHLGPGDMTNGRSIMVTPGMSKEGCERYVVQAKRVTFCIITFDTGAIVTGQSICAHIDNYDRIKGEAAAFEDAIKNAWPLFGFALADRLGRMVAYIDGNGITREPDGGETFTQLAVATGGRRNLVVALTGGATPDAFTRGPNGLGKRVAQDSGINGITANVHFDKSIEEGTHRCKALGLEPTADGPVQRASSGSGE